MLRRIMCWRRPSNRIQCCSVDALASGSTESTRTSEMQQLKTQKLLVRLLAVNGEFCVMCNAANLVGHVALSVGSRRLSCFTRKCFGGKNEWPNNNNENGADSKMPRQTIVSAERAERHQRKRLTPFFPCSANGLEYASSHKSIRGVDGVNTLPCSL